MFSDSEFYQFLQGGDPLAEFERNALTNARGLRIYYDTLVKVGFTEAEALQLTKTYQEILINFSLSAAVRRGELK